MPNGSDPLAATNLWETASPNSEAAPDMQVDASLAVRSVIEASTGPAAALPVRIGRYRVESLLGSGGFGRVYRAHDDQLGRSVAIKVPDARLLSRLPENEEYLKEARLVAQLSHPHIVPVYDVGSEPGFPCFIVSRLITGGDLALRTRQSRMSYRESAELVESLASALHQAHKQGVIHRDVKPGNILIDEQRRAYLADFGLALDEAAFGRGPNMAGTPAYMSPEQARGEGHRVDGRSDVFSLGVVFYELLTGRRPFRAENQSELMEQIIGLDPRPPRQIDDGIPREFERICLKALAKRVSERYTTASDLADDLRHALAHPTAASLAAAGILPASTAPAAGALSRENPQSPAPSHSLHVDRSTPQASHMVGHSQTQFAGSSSGPVRVVPKGLRSFDAGDADFFLDLLPGARDRDGLPQSVRFWKTRLESFENESAFSVGLLYGPSGCGKSSLVKAGLLPRLNEAVSATYFEATPEGTETRLLQALRRASPALPERDLVDSCALLRRGEALSAGRKIVLFIDQFEQWLHAHRAEEDTALARALRHCDGLHLQCVLMVRDDFWMSVTRFMRELEVRLVEGENSAAVDLFGPRHARRVLAAFGRAFGCLPSDFDEEAPSEPAEFVKQAVAGITDQGTVVPVRLALFADMVKAKPWTPASLSAMGGAAGIGAAFLEETFSASTAPPAHRYHQKAARRVLKTLLYVPGQATSIKGRMRSRADLIEACGYNRRPQDFDDLLGILDAELRLITPTEPVAKEYIDSRAAESATPDSASPAAPGAPQYYQLTHDYLVPALRDWLTRKQRETVRGRAELRLEDHSELWNSRPLASHLPAWWEVGNILAFTRRKLWTPEQRRMMRAAGKRQAIHAAVVAAVLAVLTFVGWETNGRIRAAGLADRVVQAETRRIPQILKELAPYRRWGVGPLRAARDQAELNSPAWVNSTLALLPTDPQLAETLVDRSLRAGPEEFDVLRDALYENRRHVVDRLWSTIESPTEEPPRRVAAGLLLARCVPTNDPQAADLGRERWTKSAPFLAAQLVDTAVNDTGRYQRLLEGLAPAGVDLLPAIQAIYRDRNRDASQQAIAMNAVETYGSDDARALADVLLSSGDPQRVAKRLPALQMRKSAALSFLKSELQRDAKTSLEPNWDDPPLDPAWPAPDSSLVKQIEAAHGRIAERFAFCQTLPFGDFVPLAEGLRKSGYRPIRCRPFRVADRDAKAGPQVAAVWTRDALDWRLALGLASDEVKTRSNEWNGEDFYAVDVAGYLDGTFQYALLAEKNPQLLAGQVLAGIIEGELQAAFNPLTNSAMSFEAMQFARDEAGALRFCWTLQQQKKETATSRFGLIYLFPVSEQSIERLFDSQPLPLTDIDISSLPAALSPREAAEKSLATSEESVGKNPDDVNARYQRGYWREALGRFDEAVDDYSSVIEKQPQNAAAWGRRAALNARAGREEAAHRDQARAEELQPDSFPSACVAATVAAYLGDHQAAFARAEVKAKELFRTGIYPYSLVTAYSWAASALAEKQPEQARAYGRRAVEWLRDVLKFDVRFIQSEEGLDGLRELPEFHEYLAAGKPGYGYIAINATSPDRRSTAVFGVAPPDQLSRARMLAGEGWRPISISATQPTPGSALVSVSAWQRPVVSDSSFDEFAQRHARAAAVALRLENADLTWPVLRQHRDPRAREFLIEALPRLNADPQELIGQLAQESDAAARQGLLLALEGYSTDMLSHAQRADLIPRLIELYRRDADSGVHAAADWLLRKWGQENQTKDIDRELAASGPQAGRGWYVNGQRQTLAVVAGPVEFRMGSPDYEPGKSFAERLHPRRIERTFAVATKEVTIEQFQRFLADHPEVRKAEEPPAGAPADWAQRPAIASWWEAAQYCRWLSEQEGIASAEMCYPSVAEIKEGMSLPNPFDHTGYRLPSEAEWEYAARAGAETPCSFGSSADILARYAWHKKNSGDHLWPVGLLAPNRLGLFDQYGNALEWCHNSYNMNYPDGSRGPALDVVVSGQLGPGARVQRGGWHGSEPTELRSAQRWATSPGNRNSADGFRVARTIAVVREHSTDRKD